VSFLKHRYRESKKGRNRSICGQPLYAEESEESGHYLEHGLTRRILGRAMLDSGRVTGVSTDNQAKINIEPRRSFERSNRKTLIKKPIKADFSGLTAKKKQNRVQGNPPRSAMGVKGQTKRKRMI